MSFVGLFDINTGEVLSLWNVVSSEEEKYLAGPSRALMMDDAGDLYGSLAFLNQGIEVFKIDTSEEKFKWQYQYGSADYRSYTYTGCFPEDDDAYFYIGTEFELDGTDSYYQCMPSDT
jgi:hypothetical protein